MKITLEFVEAVGIAAGAILAVTTILALASRFIARRLILPWLEESLIAPLEATRHQVTANSHTSAVPTVPDLLHSLSKQVAAMDETFSEHLAESAAAWVRFDRAVSDLEDDNDKDPV